LTGSRVSPTRVVGFLTTGAAHSAGLMLGRFPMDHCTWSSVESRDIVGSNAEGALFKIVAEG